MTGVGPLPTTPGRQWGGFSSEEALASDLRGNLNGLEEETLADFLEKNTQQHPVAPHLTLDGKLFCVTAEELKRFFQHRDGWERLRKLFPETSGLLEFSRVGFNSDLTQALVYMGQGFGPRAGSGDYWLFSRTAGEWVDVGKVRAWIA